MTFLDFAQSHGLIIDYMQTGRITRCPTVNHPRKKNGAYYYEIDFGWCMDWTVDNEIIIWKSDKANPIDIERKIKDSQKKHAQERARLNAQAAKKAQHIMSRCRNDISAYLASKGFPDMCFNMLFEDDKDPVLCVPMRINGKLSGLQQIWPDGRKKFLYGTNADKATFDIGQGGRVFLVEGFASALTTQRILDKIKIRYTIKVCFSAGNMAKLAKVYPGAFIIADNDESGTGQRVAMDSGCVYYLPERVGEDINDEELRAGILPVMMKIKSLLYKKC